MVQLALTGAPYITMWHLWSAEQATLKEPLLAFFFFSSSSTSNCTAVSKVQLSLWSTTIISTRLKETHPTHINQPDATQLVKLAQINGSCVACTKAVETWPSQSQTSIYFSHFINHFIYYIQSTINLHLIVAQPVGIFHVFFSILSIIVYYI